MMTTTIWQCRRNHMSNNYGQASLILLAPELRLPSACCQVRMDGCHGVWTVSCVASSKVCRRFAEEAVGIVYIGKRFYARVIHCCWLFLRDPHVRFHARLEREKTTVTLYVLISIALSFPVNIGSYEQASYRKSAIDMIKGLSSTCSCARTVSLWRLISVFFLIASAERFIVEVTRSSVRIRHLASKEPIPI